MKYHFKTTFALLFFTLLFCFASQKTAAQNQSAWELFERVKFENTFIEEYGMEMPWPVFTPADRAWQGKEVVIVGYIIPTAEAGGFGGLILSKFPYSMCFFCGQAGMESIAILKPKGKMPDFGLDRPYVFKGKLKLNDEDFGNLVFIIEDAALTDL